MAHGNTNDDEVLRALTSEKRWEASTTGNRRGREAQRKILERPDMLELDRYVELSGRSLSSVHNDLRATPPRLLCLTFGSQKRVPEWQLEAHVLDLVRAVFRATKDVDTWTVYFALTRKLPGLAGMSPVDAVLADGSGKNIASASSAACSAMDLH